MADIFNRAADAFGGSFSADSAQVTFAQAGILGAGSAAQQLPGNQAVGLLAQQLQFTYQQQVTRVYELGTNLAFLVAGRTQGQASMGRILGPRPIALAFYRKYGDVCQAGTNNLDIQLSAGCSIPGEFQSASNSQIFAFSLRFCVLTSIGVSMQAQDMMVNEQLQIMFCSLKLAQVGNSQAALNSLLNATQNAVNAAINLGGLFGGAFKGGPGVGGADGFPAGISPNLGNQNFVVP